MSEAITNFSIWFMALFSVVVVPENDSVWTVTKPWIVEDGVKVFEAESIHLIDQCKDNPKGYINFPVVFYAAHQIYQGSRLLKSHGDPKFQHAGNSMSAPYLNCNNLINNQDKIIWKVYAYADVFARIPRLPVVDKSKSWTPFFSETVYVGCAFGLFLLAIFAFSILYGKESLTLCFSFLVLYLGCSLYLLFLIPSHLNLDLPAIIAHRVSDGSVVTASLAGFLIMRFENLMSRKAMILHFLTCFVGLLIIVFGQNGDQIQNGASLVFPSLIIGVGDLAIRSSIRFVKKPARYSFFQLLFGWSFLIAVFAEILWFSGFHSGVSVFAIGFTIAGLMLLLSINQRIQKAYDERDLLRSSLERQVEIKTADLRSALEEKEHAQAELIQSAKLASLGTLSAGIAHEINNSVNFINGAVIPLERIVLKEIKEENQRKVSDLFKAVKEGARLTAEIVTSLRNFTGLNQSQLKEVNLHEVVESVVTILRSKIKEKYYVINEIPKDLSVFGNTVGLHQVVMNLFTNAMDAMPSGGNISVRGRSEENWTTLIIKDEGKGIPLHIIDRIFDPFFTTKEVGKGTGLGLHIVKKEIDRHNGKIKIQSNEGHGTTFEITIPKSIDARSAA